MTLFVHWKLSSLSNYIVIYLLVIITLYNQTGLKLFVVTMNWIPILLLELIQNFIDLADHWKGLSIWSHWNILDIIISVPSTSLKAYVWWQRTCWKWNMHIMRKPCGGAYIYIAQNYIPMFGDISYHNIQECILIWIICFPISWWELYLGNHTSTWMFIFSRYLYWRLPSFVWLFCSLAKATRLVGQALW